MSKPGKLLLLPALLLPAVPLAAIGWLASFTRALGDDFCSFYFADRFGLLRSIWYWRLTWSGRYSAFAADWLAVRLGGAHVLPVLLPLALLVWLLLSAGALYYPLRAASPGGPNLLVSLVLAAAWLLLLLAATPDLPQSFLWWNGMRSYALPLIALTFYALLLQCAPGRLDTRIKLVLGGLISFLLWFLSGGLSETFAVFQLGLLSFLILLRLAPPSGRRPDASLLLLAAGWAGAALSMWTIISAPGNAIRQAELPPSPALPALWTISWQGYVHYLARALRSPAHWALLGGALLLTFWIGGLYPAAAGRPGWLIPALAAGGFALSFLCFPPAVYGYSEIPPARTVIIPFFALAASLLGIAFLLGARSVALHRPALLAAALLLLAYSSLGLTRQLYAQSGSYRSFALGWDRAEASILKARAQGQASVTIPAEQNWAGVNILNDNPRFWVNVCYSQYYSIPVLGRDPG